MLRKLGNLERIRSEHSLTVKELSKASGVPRATITGLEEGAPDDGGQAGRGDRRGCLRAVLSTFMMVVAT